MKHLLATAIILIASLNLMSAQEKHPVGYSHTVSFGVSYGYGSAPLANYASGIIDINFKPGKNMPDGSYFRTRLALDVDQITGGFGAAAGATFQYMQPIVAGFYVYPFAGLKYEHHASEIWPCANDITPGLGAGLEYQFTDWIGLFAQGGYEYSAISKAGRGAVQFGIVFAF